MLLTTTCRLSSAQQQTQNTSDSGIDTIIDSGKLHSYVAVIPVYLISTDASELTFSTAIDGFASKEGISASMDPEINNVVNDEVNNFL